MNVVFVCHHGAAKSVIAAAHAERLGAERQMGVRATAFGLDPDPDVPAHVVEGMTRDGLAHPSNRPRHVNAESLMKADVIVTMGCELPATDDLSSLGARVVRWDGIPDVSDGYDAARTAIVARLEQLYAE